MGVRSTHVITRQVAQQALLSGIFAMSDEELADALENLPESEFRNYMIMSEEQINQNSHMFKITDMEEFKYPRQEEDV